MEAGNKKISVIIGVIVVIAIIAAGLIRYAKPKSRAELISELYGGEDYVICAETAIDDYIITLPMVQTGRQPSLRSSRKAMDDTVYSLRSTET